MKARMSLFFVSICVALAAGGCYDDDGEDDGSGSNGMVRGCGDLEGRWVGTEVGMGGTWTMDIEGDAIAATTNGSEVYSGIIYTNASATPNQVNFEITESDYELYMGLTALGIYELNGDQMKFASNEPGVDERPTSFVPGNGTRVFEYTKE